MRGLCSLTALLGALLLASMSSTATAAPLTNHFRVTFSDTFPDSQCGIDGTSVLNVMDEIQVFADGTSKAEARVNQVFTSAATGKSVLLFFAFQFVRAGPAIDNGDGTITFTDTSKGLQEKLKLPNGTILSRDAGLVTVNDTFDATTGDFLGETISPENGPHPDLDSGGALFCDVIVRR
jgi:hypothetical protein